MNLGQKSDQNFIKKTEKSYIPVKIMYKVQRSETYVAARPTLEK